MAYNNQRKQSATKRACCQQLLLLDRLRVLPSIRTRPECIFREETVHKLPQLPVTSADESRLLSDRNKWLRSSTFGLL